MEVLDRPGRPPCAMPSTGACPLAPLVAHGWAVPPPPPPTHTLGSPHPPLSPPGAVVRGGCRCARAWRASRASASPSSPTSCCRATTLCTCAGSMACACRWACRARPRPLTACAPVHAMSALAAWLAGWAATGIRLQGCSGARCQRTARPLWAALAMLLIAAGRRLAAATSGETSLRAQTSSGSCWAARRTRRTATASPSPCWCAPFAPSPPPPPLLAAGGSADHACQPFLCSC